jgi:hypothetical protein
MNQVRIERTGALKELAEQVSQGQCILFLGAGVHAAPPEGSIYSYPEEQRPLLGEDLAEELARVSGFCKTFPKESPRDLMRVSLCCETELGRKKLVDLLDRHLREKKKPSPALEMLATLPFRIFVTTNYDQLLESALEKSEKYPEVFVYSRNEVERTPDVGEDPTAERPLLFKMHGDLDRLHRASIVITDEDYIRFVQRMSEKDALHPVPRTIRYRMSMWPTLFVGYSLHDFNLRLLFRTLRWRVDPVDFPISFAVDREPDPLILKVWQDREGFVTFFAYDLWALVPWLYKEIRGKEYPQ